MPCSVHVGVVLNRCLVRVVARATYAIMASVTCAHAEANILSFVFVILIVYNR